MQSLLSSTVRCCKSCAAQRLRHGLKLSQCPTSYRIWFPVPGSASPLPFPLLRQENVEKALLLLRLVVRRILLCNPYCLKGLVLFLSASFLGISQGLTLFSSGQSPVRMYIRKSRHRRLRTASWRDTRGIKRRRPLGSGTRKLPPRTTWDFPANMGGCVPSRRIGVFPHRIGSLSLMFWTGSRAMVSMTAQRNGRCFHDQHEPLAKAVLWGG